MTSVSPDKLRPRWRIWITTVNCGFLIPNHLSLENLSGQKKNQFNLHNSKTIYSSILASSPLALTSVRHQGRSSWQEAVHVCCFPFSQRNCVLRAFVQYNAGSHGSRTPPIFYKPFRQNTIFCHAELPLHLMRTSMIWTKFLILHLWRRRSVSCFPSWVPDGRVQQRIYLFNILKKNTLYSIS